MTSDVLFNVHRFFDPVWSLFQPVNLFRVVGRLRRLFARRRLRRGFERVSSKDVSSRDELQHLHQTDDINSDSDDYATNHQRA